LFSSDQAHIRSRAWRRRRGRS